MCVDYYSKYPEISKLSGTTSKHIITALKSIFDRHGVPDELFSDNGTQLISAEMRNFATTWEFKHTTSSPEFPQSNGQAKRAIQTVKNLLEKSSGELLLLLYSPAQLLMGRRLKTKIPVSKNLLKPGMYRHVRSRLMNRQEKQRCYFDRGTWKLPLVDLGERVRIRQQKHWQPAVILKRHDQLRLYIVQTDNKQIYRRNRRHIQRNAKFSTTNTT